MSVRSLGSLTLDLVLKTGNFLEPLNKTGRMTERQMRKLRGDAKEAAAGIAAMTAAATAAGVSVVAFTNNAAQNAKELKNQASVANATVEEFQRMAYGSRDVGIEQDKLSDILKDVNDRIGDFAATGGGPMADFFEKIAPKVGITADAFRNLSGPQALQLYYDSLEKANLSQADLTFYLEAMASDTTALIPLLRNGGRGFSDMADEADRLGIVLSTDQVGALDKFGKKVDSITSIISTGSTAIAAEMVPALSDLADELIDVAVAFNDGDYDQQIDVLMRVGTVAAGAAGAYTAYRSAVAAATIAQWAFNASVSANPIGAAVVLLGAAAGGLFAFRDELGLSGDAAYQASLDIDGLADAFEGLTEAEQENRRMRVIGDLTEMRIEAAKLGSELTEVSRLVRDSGQLTPQGGAMPIASPEDIERGKELRSELSKLMVDIGASSELLSEYESIMAGVGEETEDNSARTRELSDEAKRAAASIDSQIEALQLQVETLGMAEDAATLYGMAQEGATVTQLAAARAALETIAAYEASEEAAENYQSLLADLRTTEEQLTAQMYERIAVLDAANVSADEYAEVAAKIAEQSFEDAPEYNGLDALIGGAFGELNKIEDAEQELQEWYERQLEELEKNRQDKADMMETWNQKEQDIMKQHQERLMKIEQARQMAQLAGAESLFGDLASISEQFAGEQSGIFKAMFAAEKAFAIASAIISIQQGIANAAALPFPANIPAMASVAAATAGIVTTIQGTNLAGMAHDGIDSVPETGTWLLQKGERVTTADTSAKLDATLARVESQMNRPGDSAGAGGGMGSPVIHVDARGATDPAATELAVNRAVREAINTVGQDFATNGKLRRQLGV
ncbi:hypothetical protein [Vreelandella glaciei]|uniref:hypothetical protein n=1 Tax=Vreelandella glaciei TaxID=186761 RepID=UPI003001BB08